MTLQDRITVSAEEMIQEMERKLERLRRFCYDGRYRALLGNTLMDHMEDWEDKIRSRRKDPFTIVVVGEFKRGKSSFINALLQEEIVITDVVPETVTMNRLSYGMHKNEAVLSGGRRLTLTDEELCRPALEKLMDEVGEPIRQLEIQRPNEMLRDIRIIDTPGLNDVADDHLETIVADAMAQADAVIYVYSVNAPLSRSEQLYIRYAILPQKYTKLFLVGNYSDTLATTEAWERIRQLMDKRISLLLPGERSYLISALDEICRVQGSARPCGELSEILEKEFSCLREAIAELIREKKTVIVADRMQRMMRSMSEELQNDLCNLEKGLEMSQNQIEEQRESLREGEKLQSQNLERACARIRASVEEMKKNATAWTEALIRRMEQENLQPYTVQDISQYYTYYCVELLQTAVQNCLELHREELLEQLSDISDDLGKGLAGAYAAGDRIRFCFRLNNKTWTRGDSITMAVTSLSGNAVINALADFVGSMTRKSEIEADKGALLANIRSKYPDLIREAGQNIENQYAGLYRSAAALLEEYYQGQIRRARETVAQYEEASVKQGEDREQMLQAVSELRKEIEALQKDSIFA